MTSRFTKIKFSEQFGLSDYVAGRRSQESLHPEGIVTNPNATNAGAAGTTNPNPNASPNGADASTDKYAKQRVGKTTRMTSSFGECTRVVLDGECRVWEDIVHVAHELMLPSCQVALLS